MDKITFPLKLRMQGSKVADLQDALQLLLDRGVLLRDDEAARRELSAALQPERAEQIYGKATSKLVSIFQQERGLGGRGEVDEPTANALNAFLREWGLLDQFATPKSYVVSGAVRREDGLPLQAVRVRAVHVAERGTIRLGEDMTDAEGRYTIRYELLPGVDGINLRVSLMDEDGELLQSSEAIRNAKPLEMIDLTLPMARKAATQRRIEGQIMLQHGLPAEQLKLRLYRRDFGGTATLLDETSTLAGGQYAFTYDPGGKAVSLEIRAVKGANQEIPLSKPLNDLIGKSRAGLNLVAPGALQPLAEEYRRLSEALKPHVGAMKNLAGAKENGDRKDLTVLSCAIVRQDAPQRWVLPKGNIEAGEPMPETALREVREETDVWARIPRALRNVSHALNGEQVKVQFCLMEAVKEETPSDRREPAWLPLDQAVGLASHEESQALLKLAEQKRLAT